MTTPTSLSSLSHTVPIYLIVLVQGTISLAERSNETEDDGEELQMCQYHFQLPLFVSQDMVST